MESAFLRMWDVPSSVIFCSSWILMLLGICYIYFSHPFLITRAPITTGIVVAFIPHILSTSIEFFSYFNWRVLFGGNGHINEQAAFFLFVLDYNVGSVGLHLMICLNWHIAQDCDVVFLCYCMGLMLLPFLVCVYIHLVADVPVKVCGSFVVSVKVFSLASWGHPATIRSWNSFLKLTTNPAHWVCGIF